VAVGLTVFYVEPDAAAVYVSPAKIRLSNKDTTDFIMELPLKSPVPRRETV